MAEPERRQSASVGSSNLTDGFTAKSQARADEETEDSARGGRQPEIRQSGRKVRLKGQLLDANRVPGRKADPEVLSRAQAQKRTEGEAVRLTEGRKPIGIAGRQIRRYSRRRKLT